MLPRSVVAPPACPSQNLRLCSFKSTSTLPRLRTLRSTSRLSALRTSSRGHGFAAWCFRSLFALAKKDAHYSATVPLAYASPSPRTFKRTLERLDVAPHARQNRQARHKRIKPPFPPPRGIPLSHAPAGWSAVASRLSRCSNVCLSALGGKGSTLETPRLQRGKLSLFFCETLAPRGKEH